MASKGLSPQKEYLLSFLRSGKWVCGRAWVDRIKDDRKRISELNRDYMARKGFIIVGEPCRGRYCGRMDCPLYARKAKTLPKLHSEQIIAPEPNKREIEAYYKRMCDLFDAGAPAEQVFSV